MYRGSESDTDADKVISKKHTYQPIRNSKKLL